VASGYERGLELIREGKYFEAHEELEDAWRAAESAERDFLQGLVHVAVAWYQAGRGKRIGCERQLEKAVRRLRAYAPTHRGLDVAAVLDSVGRAQSIVSAGSLVLPSLSLDPTSTCESSATQSDDPSS
jgi:predicted metal-dependent hydrolase